MPKAFNSAGALQELLEASVLLDLVSVSSSHSRQTDDDQIRLKSHSIITINGKMNV